ncbi:hypothetical protein A2867_03885 [Candidatus Daviesbacteria bacterium RIFCSPHIGHO2_01_FULL_40_11]|uniref:Ig-like domain-containing protein n=1 Tax=Candidatus Daviesbacteria bacterium RIFCSPHIGHO2_01_FULL_40_11 TaxID=1797762 RepID=A0A1F5JGI8_9BACT|nr:MAG: hypothetical protein A2867_03885 [Candidatus Daviesbacteria bacterium RIFCSPHIGHO2_01_FULL_40_11]
MPNHIKSLRFFVKLAFFLILYSLFSLYPNPYTLTPTSADWAFDADPPGCSISFSPASPAQRNTVITVTVTGDDGAGSGVKTVSLSGAATIPSTAASSVSTTWIPSADGTYNFSCSVEDNAGNNGSNSASFTTTNPNCNTSCSTDSDGTTPCSSAWSPNTNYVCSLAQTRTCYYSSYSGGGACAPAACTQSQTVNTCTPNPGYVCDSGVCITAPPPPTGLSALCPAPGTPATLSWGAVSGATYYIPSVGGTDLARVNAPTTSTNYSTTAGSSYAWGVRACNAAGCSSTTTDSFSCAPPSPLNLQALCPAPGNYAYLSWDPSNGATSYNVRVSGSAIPTSPVAGVNTIYNTTPGTTYSSWDVSACNSGGCSSPSAGSSFFCNWPAWIQTTGGDIHSNTGINAPGGP